MPPARDVDAVAFVVGRPAPIFSNDQTSKRFLENDFVWLTSSRALLDKGCAGKPVTRADSVYQDDLLTAKDYPQLIAPGQTVPALSVPAILAAYKFSPRNGVVRNASTTLFIKNFLEKSADPQAGFGRPNSGVSPNWCGVDFTKTVNTLERHEAAAQWLASNGRAEHPLPTTIVCGPRPRPDFCRSDSAAALEIVNRRAKAGNPAPPPDIDNLVADLKRKECL